MIITIDGPAGTGKSSVAREIAKHLGFQFLDTGAMYRMVALKALRAEKILDDHEAVSQLLPDTNLKLTSDKCLLDDEDVTEQIRSPRVSQTASIVAQIPAVREHLVSQQREIAKNCDIVSEGRDQGSVVFPHAECKFFLSADPVVRARRRHAELKSKGKSVKFEELLADQAERDHRDANRAVSPLVPAADAVLFDTSDFAFEEVVSELLRQIRQKMESCQ